MQQAQSRNQRRKARKTTAGVSTTTTVAVSPQVVNNPPKGGTKTQRRRRNRNNRRKMVLRGGPYLSPCALLYLRGVSNPFFFLDNMDVDLPCVPQMPVRRTQKVMQYAKGSMTIGASGAGYIMMTPDVVSNNNWDMSSGSGLYPTLWMSDSLYNSNLGTLLNTGGFDAPGAVNAASQSTGLGVNLNGPFNVASLSVNNKGDGQQFRIVGQAIRLRYTGTLLNQSGTFQTFEHPSHEDISLQTFASIGRFDQSKSFPVTNRWVYVTYRPTSSTDIDFRKNLGVALAYSSGVGVVPTTFNNQPDYVMGITMQGLQPNSTCEWQCVQLVEFVGDLARSATKSEADASGLDAVLSATSSSSGSVDHSPNSEKSLLRKTIDALANASSPYAPGIAAGVGRYAAGKFSKYLHDNNYMMYPADYDTYYPIQSAAAA